MKFNPFKPGSIVHPGMFSGRLDEIKEIEKALFQTKCGNPANFLIHGERGIGKSSLLLYVDQVAKGKLKPLSKNVEFNFLTVNVALEEDDTLSDVVGKLARELQNELDSNETLKKSLKDLWDFLTRWEVLGVKYKKEQLAPEELLDEFTNKVIRLAHHQAFDGGGIYFFIDEADEPKSNSGLGQFLKFFTEKLTKKMVNNVGVGIIGISTVITSIKESHASASRALVYVPLLPLEDKFRKQVVCLGLEEAKRKTDVETKITFEALKLIADLSEGYPHFIQQYAYSSFDQDSDNNIDEEDVKLGLTKANGALDQLGQMYFENMYTGEIRSDDYRKVLQAAAQKMPEPISRKELLAESGLSETQVTNAVTALKKKGSLISIDGKSGLYKLPSLSFATWIQAFKAAI